MKQVVLLAIVIYEFAELPKDKLFGGKMTLVQNLLELVLVEINKPVILIGHSMGGYIVQKYLENKDCKGAVLMAPVPCKPKGSSCVDAPSKYCKVTVPLWIPVVVGVYSI